MAILTSSFISPSTIKLLSFIQNNKLNVFHNQNQPQELKNDAPTCITIIMRKDGTPTTKCLNPKVPTRHCNQSKKHRQKLSTLIIPRLATSTSNQSIRLQQLPLELIMKILSHLDYKTVLDLSKTSKQFYTLCHENTLWQIMFKHDFIIKKHLIRHIPFYELYKNHFELEKRWRHGHVKTRYLTGHDDSVYCIVWLGNHHIISGSRDKSIQLWDLNSPRSTSILSKTAHTGSVLCLRVSDDHSFMVSGSSDATCLIWSLNDFEPRKRLLGHTGGVLDICIVHRYIVSSSRDSTIRVWDKDTGDELRRLVGHVGPVNALGSQGTQVVSASGDTTIKLWDVETGQCLKTFNGHTRGLACVKLEGNIIYSGGQDNKLKIWDVHTDSFEGRVVTGSYDRTIKRAFELDIQLSVKPYQDY
ncbi:hypothetical protein G6F70_008895 [Rhizopus microsporus]|nr:hypothetical protein G6F71_008833 [Rhizopus microsporus]KAG1194242.1 hypothetical protein G6F70_008895 [Rhizopus microsporus]KAG1206386.1 hypothetical protein G6F69_008870 [Rhizopus microsporus]KAG1226749.1 hypothetical protein G6F67_008832 [Rhizopus microsporus]